MKKSSGQAELLARVVIPLQRQMHAAKIVHRQPLAHRLSQRTISSQSQGKVFKRLVVLPGIVVRGAKIVQHRRFLFRVLQDREKLEGPQEIFCGRRCISLALVVSAQIIQGNALLPRITRRFRQPELLLELFEIGFVFQALPRNRRKPGERVSMNIQARAHLRSSNYPKRFRGDFRLDHARMQAQNLNSDAHRSKTSSSSYDAQEDESLSRRCRKHSVCYNCGSCSHFASPLSVCVRGKLKQHQARAEVVELADTPS